MEPVETERLLLRPWHIDDAEAALLIYSDADVVRWLSPVMSRVADVSSMGSLLEQWVAEDARTIPPQGRWAIERRSDRQLIGGAVLLPLPPGDEDVEIGWQLRRDAWGNGYATEAGLALARWAFGHGLHELLAVSRPSNTKATGTIRRMGMEWVGETDKYYGLRLHVYRLHAADLNEASRTS